MARRSSRQEVSEECALACTPVQENTSSCWLVDGGREAIRVRTIHRLADEDRWNADAITAITSIPRKPTASGAEEDPQARTLEAEENADGGAMLKEPETSDGKSWPRELRIDERLLI